MSTNIGKKFGRLTVISRIDHLKCLVRCDCGKEKEVWTSNLRNTRSCGCIGGRRIDLVGQKFGLLTVLKCAGSKRLSSGYPLVTWLVRCDCGTEKEVIGKDLKNGNIRSCGCLWKLPVGQAAKNRILRSYKDGASKRGLGWELTDEQFDNLTRMNCHYCGALPSEHQYNPHFNGAYKCNGIDRKDNADGYVLGNCLPACKDCNWMKGTMSYENFVAFLKKAGQFQLGINATGISI